MRRIAVASIALLFCFQRVAGANLATASEYLMLRATSVLPDSVAEVLEDIATPQTLTVGAKASVEAAIRTHCGGSVSNHYRSSFVSLNQARHPSPLLAASASRDMQFPPCPRIWRTSVPVPVQTADSLNSLLARELGAKPTTKLLICPDPDNPTGAAKTSKDYACRTVSAQEFIARQIGQDDGRFETQAQRPTQLWLPFISRWTSIELKDGEPFEVAREHLLDAARASVVGEDLVAIQPSAPVNLETPIDSDDPSLVGSACDPSQPPPTNWPFDRAEVAKAISAAVDFLKLENLPINRAVIRVADSGVSGLTRTPAFPRAFLATNPNTTPGDTRRDRDGFAGAYYGINADYGGDVEPLRDDPNGTHGTEVANLALGGTDLRASSGALSELLGLSVARVVTSRPGNGVWTTNDALILSLTYTPPQANIVNFSLGGQRPIPTLEAPLNRMFETRQIVVMAAGNDGADISVDRHPLYPAVYSGDQPIRGSALVVGAHGPLGPDGAAARAYFSNYGKGYVALLAPGCLLRPISYPNGVLVAGTSFAAPLVAFTAGLVRDFLGAPDNVEVYNRLWATTRWTSDRDNDETIFGGVPDIPTALRVFDDTVRLRDGTVVTGRWLEPQRFAPCADLRPISPDLVLRVRSEPKPSAPPLLHMLLNTNRGLVSEEPACIAAVDDGLRLKLEDGKERMFKWAEVAALIPATDLRKRRIPQDGGSTPPASVKLEELQSALAALGAKVTVDGKEGPETRAAIREFQKSRLNAPTGALTDIQVRSLVMPSF